MEVLRDAAKAEQRSFLRLHLWYVLKLGSDPEPRSEGAVTINGRSSGLLEVDALQTGDGRRLPQHLKAQVCRELDRLELLLEQIKAVEAERDALLNAE